MACQIKLLICFSAAEESQLTRIGEQLRLSATRVAFCSGLAEDDAFTWAYEVAVGDPNSWPDLLARLGDFLDCKAVVLKELASEFRATVLVTAVDSERPAVGPFHFPSEALARIARCHLDLDISVVAG